jgi:hypothetical protein
LEGLKEFKTITRLAAKDQAQLVHRNVSVMGLSERLASTWGD